MSTDPGEFDSFGLKVQRAQRAVTDIRGTGTVRGITVEVDAENRIVSIGHPDEAALVAAYQAAVRDKQPRVDDAMRAVLDDPQSQAVSTFLDANIPAAARRRRPTVSDDDYFESFRQDPLGRNR